MGLCPSCGRQTSGYSFCPDDGTELLPDAEEAAVTTPLPRQLDRYRIARKIGQGATSDVFEAEHIHTGKRVALKLLRRDLAGDERAVERLRREARTTSTIGHRNIVQVEDFGVAEDGSVFLAMEWLEGETLAARLERGPVRPAMAVDLVLQIAAGLGAAHAAGIIHRDLKPANVFLVPQPDGGDLAKLLDFGIAKLLPSDARLTRTGTFIGTPDYVAPEQALGEPVDARADLYALGVVFYQLLTGTLPFRAESFMAVLHRHATEPPEPPSRRAPQRAIAPAIEAVVLRCMAKRRADRFASAGDLARALEAARAPRFVMPAESSISIALPRRRVWPWLVLGAAGAAAGLALLLRDNREPGAEAPPAIATGGAGSLADASPRADTPAIDAAPPADVWTLAGKADGFDYTVSVAPRAIVPGQPFQLDVEILPGQLQAGSWPDSVRARLTFSHEARRVELRGEFPVEGDRMSAALILPRPGTHLVDLALLDGATELGRTDFDLCVGADPSGGRRALERVCPRMRLSPRPRR